MYAYRLAGPLGGPKCDIHMTLYTGPHCNVTTKPYVTSTKHCYVLLSSPISTQYHTAMSNYKGALAAQPNRE